MASHEQLDASRRARNPGVMRTIAGFLLLVCSLPQTVLALEQDGSPEMVRLSAAQAAFDRGAWEEAVRLAQGPPGQPPDLDFLAGLALARLERWKEAEAAFAAGRRKAPGDARFPIELAGVAYKQKDYTAAKRELQAALRLAPHDAYAREFLGTIYLLEGNLEAALKSWNAVNQPRLHSVTFDPPPQLRTRLLERAVTFNAPQILTAAAIANTQARLANLAVFPEQRVELAASPTGEYDAVLHLATQNGWGDSPLEGMASLLSGLPYDTVYPEFYNLGHTAVNFTSLARWDSEKRRFGGEFSAPLLGDPALRLRAYFDARNENWNLSQSFFGPGSPLTDLNMRRLAGGVRLRSVVNGNWSWSTGVELAHRDFRNLAGHSASAEQPFFSDANSFVAWLGVDRSLLRIPERRFTLDSTAEGRVGRTFNAALGPFATGRAALRAHWLPQATGDDYEMQAQIRGGATAGKVPFDDLFELGLERDNDLWLRGQPGTLDGRKGAAPLGRRYFLANWELDKNVYRGAFFGVKLGPFFDEGAIADSSGLFGSRGWLPTTGAQCKIRILGGVNVVLIYGRDLRGGRNVFYGSSLR